MIIRPQITVPSRKKDAKYNDLDIDNVLISIKYNKCVVINIEFKKADSNNKEYNEKFVQAFYELKEENNLFDFDNENKQLSDSIESTYYYVDEDKTYLLFATHITKLKSVQGSITIGLF